MSAARAALGRLAARLSRRPLADPVAPAQDLRPRPMTRLHPPAAVNDNPLAALETEVERDLRSRGFLR